MVRRKKLFLLTFILVSLLCFEARSQDSDKSKSVTKESSIQNDAKTDSVMTRPASSEITPPVTEQQEVTIQENQPTDEIAQQTIDTIEAIEQKILRPIPSVKPISEIEVSPEVDDWISQVHENITNRVHESAIWFDGFFNDQEENELTPQSLARISTSWLPRARDWSEVKVRFKLKVRLPYFENKVDVIFSDDDAQDQLPLESAQTKGSFEDDSFAAAVRYIHSQNQKIFSDTRVGISGGALFVRTRHKRNYVWRDKHSFVFTPSAYYYTDDGLGARLLLEYDYQLNPDHQFRANYSIRGSESFSGIRWKHGVYYLRHISDKEASVAGLLVEGERNGENGFLIENYTLSYRYRFNAIKKWLFFEIEPFMEWPEEVDYKATPGIALKVEGYFAKG